MLLAPKPTRVPRLSAVARAQIAVHYRLAGPLLAPYFSGTPLAFGAYPAGLGGELAVRGALDRGPAGVPTCDVPGAFGVRSYLAYGEPALRWALKQAPTVELYGWGCTSDDPERARFARIVLELDDSHDTALTLAATVMQHCLRECGVQAIPVLQGTRSLTLWIPLSGGPRYPDIRMWLRQLLVTAAAKHPTLLSLERNARVPGRVHPDAGVNAPGGLSVLPYSLLGEDDALRACIPISWSELPTVRAETFTARNFAQRLSAAGDTFATAVRAIGEQALPLLAVPTLRLVPRNPRSVEPHARILRAAAVVLRDGRARDAKAILTESRAKRLVAPIVKERHVATALLEYLVRASACGQQPLIAADLDRRFRIDRPRDAWPPTDSPAAPPVGEPTQGVLERLTSAATGGDSRAFAVAVCDAFAHLGFVVTHCDREAGPIAVADAPLGTLGYRVTIACKNPGDTIHDRDVARAFARDGRSGEQAAAIVGFALCESAAFAGELLAHEASAWSADDLQRVLRVGSNPLEMRDLLAPGFASDRIAELLWKRLHGNASRVLRACKAIAEAGWAMQVADAKSHGASAPALTLEAATSLVNRRLAEGGAAEGCSHDDVRAAFEHLTNPAVGRAIRPSAASGESIVVLAAPR